MGCWKLPATCASNFIPILFQSTDSGFRCQNSTPAAAVLTPVMKPIDWAANLLKAKLKYYLGSALQSTIPSDATTGQQQFTPLHEAVSFPLIHVWIM